MKRGATKEEIIRTTLDLITRNGLRAVRVDEIAQMLGISKRTLYEMFADKNDLISACLNDMARQQRRTSTPTANGAAEMRCRKHCGWSIPMWTASTR